jgi:hypothetical protein
MKNITNILLALILVLQLVNLGFNIKSHFSVEKSPVTNDVKIEAVAEPSPFDNVANDPYYNPPSEAQGPITIVSFDRIEHNFGKLKDGEKPFTTFKFTNTGKEDLVISNATGSCGCTVPEWPKEPIKPGKSGSIKVEFDSKDKLGEQIKTVSVTSNTEPSINTLTIKATVLPKQ